MLIGKIFTVIFPAIETEYTNTNIFRPWKDPLMLMYFLYPFILAFVLTWLWNKTKSLFTGSTFNRVLNFTVMYWLVATLPGMFITLSSFKVSLIMIISWTVGSFCEVFCAGLVFAKMNK